MIAKRRASPKGEFSGMVGHWHKSANSRKYHFVRRAWSEGGQIYAETACNRVVNVSWLYEGGQPRCKVCQIKLKS